MGTGLGTTPPASKGSIAGVGLGAGSGLGAGTIGDEGGIRWTGDGAETPSGRLGNPVGVRSLANRFGRRKLEKSGNRSSEKPIPLNCGRMRSLINTTRITSSARAIVRPRSFTRFMLEKAKATPISPAMPIRAEMGSGTIQAQ